jgi:sterol desaturase/sphingolipid hydroxylase (fatty acid hydroxylase superfamily)
MPTPSSIALRAPAVASAWRSVLRWTTFPAALALASLAAVVLHNGGLPAMPVQMATMLGALALVWMAERALPYRLSWREPPGAQRRVDLTSLAVLMALADPFIKRALLPLVASLAVSLGAAGSTWFAAALPLPLQVALALVIAELGQYAAHRAGHRVRWMWAVHGFHHNPTRLHWLNGFRVNPLNLVWHQLAGLGVLVLIGAPEPVLQSVIAFGTVVGIFQHVNADLRFDGWNRVFSTADQHRWHHAADAGVAQCNFGAVLMLWDQVFGTYRRERRSPTRVGVAGFEPVARGYLAGLVEAVRMAWRR